MMKLAILESPYRGYVTANVAYARQKLGELVRSGYAPIASHLLYTQPGVLDDGVPAERALGMQAGLAWRHTADVTIFAAGMGWSEGMVASLFSARAERRPYLVIDGPELNRPHAPLPPPDHEAEREVLDRLTDKAQQIWPDDSLASISRRMSGLMVALGGPLTDGERLHRAMEAALDRLLREA